MSGLVDASRWLVYAVLEYRPGLSAETRRRVEAEARLELMIGVVRESGLGRDRGARIVNIMVEGDPETAGFFRLLRRGTDPIQAT